jgi:hypothetical protein
VSQTTEPAPGFQPLETVVEDFVGLDREGFVARYPDALIIFDEIGQLGEADPGFQTLSKKPKESKDTQDPRQRILGRLESRVVYRLTKQRDKFACMVTVGRAANNVLRLNVPSVSKFHAYFTHVAREKAWYVADANSSNGTFIDGQELPPSHGKVLIKNGTTLRFGPDVTGQFYDAAGFYELLSAYKEGRSSAEDTLSGDDVGTDTDFERNVGD